MAVLSPQFAMYFVIYLTILRFAASSPANGPESDVAQAFMNDEIVNKIVLEPPTKLISVNYLGMDIYLGTPVEPLQTLRKPQVSYEANDSDLYTLMFFGPDLPPSIVPPFTQLIHWLVVNIPGQDISKGSQIATYFPPVPYPEGFPYIFLLFMQNGSLDTSQIPNMSFLLSRPQFSPGDFASKYNLGKPIAGNFMREAYTVLLPQVLETVSDLLQAVFG